MPSSNSTFNEPGNGVPTGWIDSSRIGKKIETKFGEGRVINIDVLKQTYRVDVKDHGIVEVDVNEGN